MAIDGACSAMLFSRRKKCRASLEVTGRKGPDGARPFRALADLPREVGHRRSLDLTDDEPPTHPPRFPRPIAFIQPVFTMGGGGKIYYPKEVWSPAGGWYAQPGNWRANTAAIGAVILGISVFTWSLSAEREYRDKMPEPGRFFPSRYWSKQIIEHEKATKESS